MSDQFDESDDDLVTPEPVDPRFAFGPTPAGNQAKNDEESEAIESATSDSGPGEKTVDSFVDFSSSSDRQDTVYNPSTPNIVEATAGADSNSLDDPIIGQTLENYRVTKLIGRGGFGAVFLARDTKLKRNAAIKLLHQGKDQEFIKRFMLEAQVLANLSKHPSIVQIYTWGEWKGEPYFVLEYLDRSADSLLKIHREGLPLLQVLNIGVQASAALAHAHKHDILHRDLKPENILIDDATGAVKLCDFGLALLKGPDDDITTTVVAGSPAFMSPEQASGKALDGRSDIFSLGVTLYKLLSGEIPYKGKSQGEIFSEVIHHEGLKLSEIRPDLPKAVVDVVERCMEIDPNKRYASAELLEADLRRLANDLERSGAVQDLAVTTHRSSRLWIGVAALMLVVATIFGVDRFYSPSGSTSNEPATVLAEADAWLAEGRPAEAARLLKNYIEAGNTEDEARYLLSVAHAQSGDRASADEEASAMESEELRSHLRLAMVVAFPNSKMEVKPSDAFSGLAAASQEFRQEEYEKVAKILDDYAATDLKYAWERARYRQLEALALQQLALARSGASTDYGNLSAPNSLIQRTLLAMNNREASAEHRAVMSEQISSLQNLMDEAPARTQDLDTWSSRLIRIRIEAADPGNSAFAANSGLALALPELLAGGIEQVESGRYKIVNREFIGDVLFEQQLSELSEAGSETRVGRLLGASLLVQAKFGEIFNEDGLNIKLVDCETSEQSQLPRMTVSKSMDLNTWLEEVIGNIVSKIEKAYPLKAMLTVTGSEASINIGAAHGVETGMRFQAFPSPHAPSPLTGVSVTVRAVGNMTADVDVTGGTPQSGWFLKIAQ